MLSILMNRIKFSFGKDCKRLIYKDPKNKGLCDVTVYSCDCSWSKTARNGNTPFHPHSNVLNTLIEISHELQRPYTRTSQTS